MEWDMLPNNPPSLAYFTSTTSSMSSHPYSFRSLIPVYLICGCPIINTFPKWQSCRRFSENIFQLIFFDWKLWHFDKNFTGIYSCGMINNNTVLAQILDRHWTDDKELSETKMAQGRYEKLTLFSVFSPRSRPVERSSRVATSSDVSRSRPTSESKVDWSGNRRAHRRLLTYEVEKVASVAFSGTLSINMQPQYYMVLVYVLMKIVSKLSVHEYIS